MLHEECSLKLVSCFCYRFLWVGLGYMYIYSQTSFISIYFRYFYCCQSSQKSLLSFFFKIKSSASKIKFRKASNHCKGFLRLLNLLTPVKLKSLSLPRNLAPETFRELPILLSNNAVNNTVVPVFMYLFWRKVCGKKTFASLVFF